MLQQQICRENVKSFTFIVLTSDKYLLQSVLQWQTGRNLSFVPELHLINFIICQEMYFINDKIQNI